MHALAPLNLWPGRMEPVCGKAASRQGQGQGFAGACVRMCVLGVQTAWKCGQVLKGALDYTSEMYLSK